MNMKLHYRPDDGFVGDVVPVDGEGDVCDCDLDGDGIGDSPDPACWGGNPAPPIADPLRRMPACTTPPRKGTPEWTL